MVALPLERLSAKGLGKATPGNSQRAAVPGREALDALLEEWARTDAAAMAHLISLIPSAHLKVHMRRPQPASGAVATVLPRHARVPNYTPRAPSPATPNNAHRAAACVAAGPGPRDCQEVHEKGGGHGER